MNENGQKTTNEFKELKPIEANQILIELMLGRLNE